MRRRLVRQSWSVERRNTLAALNQRLKLLDASIDEVRRVTSAAAGATAAASPAGRVGRPSKELNLGGAAKATGLASWSKAFATSGGAPSEGAGVDEQIERMLQRLSVDFSRVVNESTALVDQAATDPITRLLQQVGAREERGGDRGEIEGRTYLHAL